MTETTPDTTPSRHPTGTRGTDVGPLRATVARVGALALVYGTLAVLLVLPLVGFALIGTIGLIGGSFVLVYVLLTLKESDYTLYTIRLALIDTIRTGEWPR